MTPGMPVRDSRNVFMLYKKRVCGKSKILPQTRKRRVRIVFGDPFVFQKK